MKIVKIGWSMSLQESKELVESAPKVIKKNITPEEAETLRAKLEAAGAKVEIE